MSKITEVIGRIRGVATERLPSRRQVFALALALALVVWMPALLTGLGGVAPVGSDHSGTAAAADADELIFKGVYDGGVKLVAMYPNGTEEWSGHSDFCQNIYAIETSPDGETVYAADNCGAYKAIDASTGDTIWTSSIHSDGVNDLSVSPDGETVYSVASDDTFQAVDAADGSVVFNNSNVGTNPQGVFMEPNGEYIYVATAGAPYLKKFDTQNNRIWTVSSFTGDPMYLNDVAVSPDGSKIYVPNQAGYLDEFNANGTSGDWAVQLSTYSMEAITLSPDGETVYAGDNDNNVAAYSSADGSSQWERAIGTDNTYDMAASHDDASLFLMSHSDGSYELDPADGSTIQTYSYASTYSVSLSGYVYPQADPVSNQEAGTDQSVGLVEDDLEMFPPSDTGLVVNRRTSDYYPLWEVAGYSVEEWRQEAWVEEERSSFNWANKTAVSLEDGEYYRLELHSPYGTWEDSGFQYDASEYAGSTIWLEPNTGHLDDNGDGTAGGSGSEGTNGPGSGDSDDGNDGGSDDEDQGFGPTALSSCTTLDGQDGVEVEYWDPGYETWELEANLSADGSKTYHVHKEFSDARGYYRGCLGDSVTENSSDDRRDLSWNHTARNETGAIVSSGGLSYDPPVFGPTGNAPDSTGERVGLLAGVLGALGVLWFGGQRYVPASSVSAWPSESISPAFGIGAPIVAVLGLDLAGGGVISASVATGLAQIAPFAGIVGVTVGGYAVLRWIRAPPS